MSHGLRRSSTSHLMRRRPAGHWSLLRATRSRGPLRTAPVRASRRPSDLLVSANTTPLDEPIPTMFRYPLRTCATSRVQPARCLPERAQLVCPGPPRLTAVSALLGAHARPSHTATSDRRDRGIRSGQCSAPPCQQGAERPLACTRGPFAAQLRWSPYADSRPP